MLIFLIEDDEALAEGISFMLVKEGYETERFSACSDSRRALEQIQPDLILLDLSLIHISEMLTMDICNTAFSRNMYGMAQAKGIIFLIVVAFITVSQLMFTKSKEVEM